jgi:hypothetical protein
MVDRRVGALRHKKSTRPSLVSSSSCHRAALRRAERVASRPVLITGNNLDGYVFESPLHVPLPARMHLPSLTPPT